MPSITITITGVESQEDLLQALSIFFGGDLDEDEPVATDASYPASDYMPATDNVGAATQPAEARNEAPKPRRGRPKKQEPAPLEGQEEFPFVEDVPAAQSAEEPAVETAKELTLDDAKDAGRKLLMAKGADALRKLLDTYGLRKVGDLQKESFEKFIRECENRTVEKANG